VYVQEQLEQIARREREYFKPYIGSWESMAVRELETKGSVCPFCGAPKIWGLGFLIMTNSY